MRIIAGQHKGRILSSPDADRREIRPTSDRLREAVFNVLAHQYIDDFSVCTVLDLFAGTGALGLEALSRGAARAVFVDQSPYARGLMRENIEKLGCAGIAKTFRRDATQLGDCGVMPPFNLIFCDPPYGKALGEAALISADKGGWLSKNAIVVLEETAQATTTLPPAFTLQEQRIYGDTQVVFALYES
jgi:16S rRNA (guanine966-N2)-methyltransferase